MEVQISFDVFLAILDPFPIWRYSDVFSQLLTHMTFSANPNKP